MTICPFSQTSSFGIAYTLLTSMGMSVAEAYWAEEVLCFFWRGGMSLRNVAEAVQGTRSQGWDVREVKRTLVKDFLSSTGLMV